jgi:ribosomal protein S20
MGSLHGTLAVLNVVGMKASLDPPFTGGFAPALAGSGAAGQTAFWSRVVANPVVSQWVVKTVAPAAMTAYIAFFESRGGGSQWHHGVPKNSSKYNYSDHPLVKKAGWSKKELENNPANRLRLGNHAGPHSKAYHEAIKTMLDEANKKLGAGGKETAEKALKEVLGKIDEGIANGTLKPYDTKDVFYFTE